MLSRVVNFFNWFGSLSFLTRYSSVVYEGDELSLFGIAKYNKFHGIWEITKPISIMKEGFGKVISHLNRE